MLGNKENGQQYIILEISSNIDCLDKREVTSSESNYYMGRTGKGLTNFLDISTKRSNNKQKARFEITDITNHDFRKLIKKYKIHLI